VELEETTNTMNRDRTVSIDDIIRLYQSFISLPQLLHLFPIMGGTIIAKLLMVDKLISSKILFIN
jgi:hypothetical protein